MKKKFHWRLWLLTWHRRIGLLLSLFLLWMLISGALLNHTDDFHWDKDAISSKFWLDWYGVAQTTDNIKIANKTLTITDSGLYLAQQNLGECTLLLGVVPLSHQVVIACSQHILLLTEEGELIDQIDNHQGLQPLLTATTSENNTVFLQDTQSIIYRLNTDDLSLSVSGYTPKTWLTPVSPYARISVERWLLDAHSGRLFGHWGVWLIDTLSLLLVILVISGWVLAKKRHKRMP